MPIPIVTEAVLEEAHAWDEARTWYIRWHWQRFKAPPEAALPPRPLGPPKDPEAKALFGICPRCGASRRLGSTTRHNPLAPCRPCTRLLLPLVPHEHRRRGFATTEGYTLALQREREQQLPRRKRRDDPERKRRERAARRARDPEGERLRERARDARRRAKRSPTP